MKEIHRYSFPTQIYFGAGARHLVAREIKARGVTRPLLVTDATIAALPFAGEFQAELNAAGLSCGLYAGRPGNPTESDVTLGVKKYREHDADSIIALGGGASIDVAKAVAVMVDHPGGLFDYEDEREGALPIIAEKIPVVMALPTTAMMLSAIRTSNVLFFRQRCYRLQFSRTRN